MMVSFMLFFLPQDVLDEVLDFIESVSEGFSTYSCKYQSQRMGFELPVSDASLYALLAEQGHF